MHAVIMPGAQRRPSGGNGPSERRASALAAIQVTTTTAWTAGPHGAHWCG